MKLEFLKKGFYKKIFILNLFFLIFTNGSYSSANKLKNYKKFDDKVLSEFSLKNSEIKWIHFQRNIPLQEKIKWNKLPENEYQYYLKNISKEKKPNNKKLNSLNRSIVFDNKIIGPDISWLVPPGLKWSHKYKFDGSIRGHNRRKKGQNFLSWNGGDAVGQFYYQPFHKEKYSFGLNLGVRSIYQGPNAGGGTSIGEGLSSGFRLDHSLSETSGIAFGAEQLLHFDHLTDTGRDIYLTISKGFWMNKYSDTNSFPLIVATAGVGTGKMAEGNIKGLCSNLLAGSGTEVNHQRRLCWAPIFSIAKVYNDYLSTFFEYNSKFFLLGTSLAPFQEIPIRGTFALQISDHIENYKVNSFDDLKWVFRLSLGF
tara:strand:+ start:49 stop:1152 length:1104 start_codon:yes stop_codon:yes gene_type:complete